MAPSAAAEMGCCASKWHKLRRVVRTPASAEQVNTHGGIQRDDITERCTAGALVAYVRHSP
jgi:hypothetical protein